MCFYKRGTNFLKEDLFLSKKRKPLGLRFIKK